jgi:hypothetical protein
MSVRKHSAGCNDIPVAMPTSGDRSVKLDFNNFRVADDAGGRGLRPTQGRYGSLVRRFR